MLQRLSLPALWHQLRRQRPRPTAVTPPASLMFESVRAIAADRGTWRAPLIGGHQKNSYLGTLVIVTTVGGPRVAAIEG